MLYPEGTKVVVIPDTVDDMTEGGIWKPDAAVEDMQHAVTRGEIFAIGPRAKVHFLDKDGVKVSGQAGDRVMFVKYAGASLKLKSGEEPLKDAAGNTVFQPGSDNPVMKTKYDEYRFIQDEDIVCRMDIDEPDNPDTRKSMVK